MVLNGLEYEPHNLFQIGLVISVIFLMEYITALAISRSRKLTRTIST
jgi:hypothetical protein